MTSHYQHYPQVSKGQTSPPPPILRKYRSLFNLTDRLTDTPTDLQPAQSVGDLKDIFEGVRAPVKSRSVSFDASVREHVFYDESVVVTSPSRDPVTSSLRPRSSIKDIISKYRPDTVVHSDSSYSYSESCSDESEPLNVRK